MKLSCLQENLSRALTVTRRVVPNRTPMPVTQNILLTAENSLLSVTTTNLTMAMTYVIGANVEEEGSVTIPAVLLGDFIGSLPAERVDIELIGKPVGINVKCAGFECNISGTPASDFPPIPTVKDGHMATVEPGVFQEAISQVVFAAAADDNRPVLSGVYGEVSADEMKLVAADGFRLAIKSVALGKPAEEDFTFLVPAKTLSEVGRLLNNQEGSVEFTVTPNDNQVVFRLEEVEIVSNLLSGAFPNYENLIPAGHKTRVVVNSDDFRRATRSAAIFARDNGQVVRLQSGANAKGEEHLCISAQTEEVGDNKGEIPASFEGETDAKIAFNSRYLTDFLNTVEGDVHVDLNSDSTPGVVKPVDSDKYQVIIMPMFVQWT